MKGLSIALFALVFFLSPELSVAGPVEVDSEVYIYSQLDAMTIGAFEWNEVPLREVLQEIVSDTTDGRELSFKLSEELEKTRISLELSSQTTASALCRICKHTESEWLIDSGDIIIRPQHNFVGSRPDMLVEAFMVTRAMVIRPTPRPYKQSAPVDPFAPRDPALWYQDFTSFDKSKNTDAEGQKPGRAEK